MKIIEIEPGGETPEPGIYVVKNSHTWGFKPMRSDVGDKEWVPYEWGLLFASVVEFMTRFPTYWQCDDQRAVWVGQNYHPEAVYWARRTTRTPI